MAHEVRVPSGEVELRVGADDTSRRWLNGKSDLSLSLLAMTWLQHLSDLDPLGRRVGSGVAGHSTEEVAGKFEF